MNKRGKDGGRRRRTKYGLARQRQSHLYGALDLGTNNCRLLIAKPSGPGFRVIASYSKIVRLGEGLSRNGALSEDAMARTIAALSICAGKLKDFDVARSRIVATEACRRAGNCAEFLGEISDQTGLQLETISYEEEARLALVGCQNLLTRKAPYALVFDIGGGSTELTWAHRIADNRFEILDVLSLPFGVVTLAEECDADQIGESGYRKMVDDIASHLPPFCAANGIGGKVTEGEVQMLGTSGTVTTLGAVHLNLPYYSRSRIDGLEMAFDQLATATRRLSKLNFEDRAALPCIGEERAELVVPGCAILEAICRSWPVGRLRVADRGLREGMLLELMAEDGNPITGNAPQAVAH